MLPTTVLTRLCLAIYFGYWLLCDFSRSLQYEPFVSWKQTVEVNYLLVCYTEQILYKWIKLCAFFVICLRQVLCSGSEFSVIAGAAQMATCIICTRARILTLRESPLHWFVCRGWAGHSCYPKAGKSLTWHTPRLTGIHQKSRRERQKKGQLPAGGQFKADNLGTLSHPLQGFLSFSMDQGEAERLAEWLGWPQLVMWSLSPLKPMKTTSSRAIHDFPE